MRKANSNIKLKGICNSASPKITTLFPSPSYCVFPYKAATSPATIPTMPPIPATKVGAAAPALAADELDVEAALALELFELVDVLLLLDPLLVCATLVVTAVTVLVLVLLVPVPVELLDAEELGPLLVATVVVAVVVVEAEPEPVEPAEARAAE
jgi:hypothetical protein